MTNYDLYLFRVTRAHVVESFQIAQGPFCVKWPEGRIIEYRVTGDTFTGIHKKENTQNDEESNTP